MKQRIIFVILLVLASIIVFFMLGNPMAQNVNLTLNSSSFENGKDIPQKFTCDGADISPELVWGITNGEHVKSYVLVVDDPDAQPVVGKTFVHWIVLLPFDVTSLPEGISSKQGSSIEKVSEKALEIPNDFDKTNYGGPCPPQSTGKHTYRFTMFATTKAAEDMTSDFYTKSFTAEEFEEKMRDNILASARIHGKYTREG